MSPTKTTPPGAPPAPDHPAPGIRRRPGDHQRPYVWFRLHIKLASGHGPLALLVQLPVSHTSSISVGSGGPGIDVFANGKQIQPEGPHGDEPGRYQPMSRIYRLNVSPDATSLVLAVRTIYIPVGYATYTGFFANRTFILGHPEDLEPLARALVESLALRASAAASCLLPLCRPGHLSFCSVFRPEGAQRVSLAGAP